MTDIGSPVLVNAMDRMFPHVGEECGYCNGVNDVRRLTGTDYPICEDCRKERGMEPLVQLFAEGLLYQMSTLVGVLVVEQQAAKEMITGNDYALGREKGTEFALDRIFDRWPYFKDHADEIRGRVGGT